MKRANFVYFLYARKSGKTGIADVESIAHLNRAYSLRLDIDCSMMSSPCLDSAYPHELTAVDKTKGLSAQIDAQVT